MLHSLSFRAARRRGAATALTVFGVAFVYGVHADQPIPPPVTTHLPAILSLQDAISIALRAQPQQQLAKAQIDSALGTRQQAVSQYYPTITPSYTFQNSRNLQYGVSGSQLTSTTGTGTGTTGTGTTGTGTTGTGTTGTGTTGTGTTGTGTTGTGTTGTTGLTQTTGDNISIIRGGGTTITLKQTILDTGQRELANAQARQQVEAANDLSEDTRQQIIANVTSSFYNLLAAEDLVKVAQAQVTENQQTVDLTQAELTAGTAAKTDVYQAQANLATAQVTLIQNQNQAQVNAAALKNAMGIVTTDPVQPQSLTTGTALPPIPASPAIATLDQYFKIAQQNRNDLKAQLATVETNREAVKIARINAGLSLTADYLLTYQPQNDVGAKNTASALTITASSPLFDGGFSRGAVRIADAALRTALANLEVTRQTILEAVEQDYATRAESLQAINYAQVAVQAAQVNYDAAVASREAGVGTVLQITTAEATLTQAQNQYVSAIYNYYIADSNLKRAAGLQ